MDVCNLVDDMLRHGTMFVIALTAFFLLLIWLKKLGIADWLWDIGYKLVPLFVVFFCIGFFVYVFENSHMTEKVSCDYFHLKLANSQDVIQSEQNHLEDEINALAKAVNEKIEKVSSTEHDRFQAELSAWLSVFGLLSIIATLVVPVATYKAQYASLEKKFKELEKRYAAQKTQSDEIQSQIDDQDARSSESFAFSQNGGKSGGGVCYDILNKCRMEKADVLDLRVEPGDDCHEEITIKAGKTVNILHTINDKVLTKSNDADVLKLSLNIINSINVFLGTRVSRDSGFTKEFLRILKKEQPLKISQVDMDQRVAAQLPDRACIYKGFYNALYLKQG